MIAKVTRIAGTASTILLALIGCTVYWIAHSWQPGKFYWAANTHVTTALHISGELRGLAVARRWFVTWSDGLIAMGQIHTERTEDEPYYAPEGFPYDSELARQFREAWQAEMIEASRSKPTHGYTEINDGLPGATLESKIWNQWGFQMDIPTIPTPPVLTEPWGIHQSVRAPAWAVATICFVPTIVTFIQLLRWGFRRRRIVKGLCRHCGYDLRGGQAICPECGNAATANASNSTLA